jgi:hypothetical protein
MMFICLQETKRDQFDLDFVCKFCPAPRFDRFEFILLWATRVDPLSLLLLFGS